MAVPDDPVDPLAPWRRLSGREVYRFARHAAAVTCVAVLPGGGQVLSGGRDQTLILWDVRTGRLHGRSPAGAVRGCC